MSVCCLFNDAVNSSDSKKRQIVGWLQNSELKRIWEQAVSGLIRGAIPTLIWRGWRKSQNIWVRVLRFLSEIWIQNLSRTKQECYSFRPQRAVWQDNIRRILGKWIIPIKLQPYIYLFNCNWAFARWQCLQKNIHSTRKSHIHFTTSHSTAQIVQWTFKKKTNKLTN
jgi:hypothetical protein